MKKLIPFLIIFFLGIIGIYFWWQQGLSPVDVKNKTRVTFVVEKNETAKEIGVTLQKDHLIHNSFIFLLRVKQLGLDDKIQTGDFFLSPSMSLTEIILTLTQESQDVWITIPEGRRATEIAETIASKIPTYTASWKDKLVEEEGYLFPDTYLIPKDATVQQVIDIMEKNFNQKYEQAKEQQTNSLSQEQAIILASVLQREGRSLEDMRMIASVLENRLEIGMALQVDATIQYALGYQPIKQTWWKPQLTAQDLKIDSPYNTYLNPGLPPTPISNPGLDAIEAVLNPSKTDYLYYISDNTGKLHFAKTLEEHNRNIQKYL